MKRVFLLALGIGLAAVSPAVGWSPEAGPGAWRCSARTGRAVPELLTLSALARGDLTMLKRRLR